VRAGFTAPGIRGQARVIRAAQALAEVPPDSITYVEAHGTATRLGDPIEVAALTQAFRAGTSRRQFCALGSVKSNVGHLDVAAGVTGLIKTALALAHREIPPSLHFERPNPELDLASSPFYVSAALAPWSGDGGPRRAGVSSFGLGGTNAHVILEEAPPQPASGPSRPHQLLLLSARTATALPAAAQDLARWLRAHPDERLADVASTLQLGRHAFAERLAVVASTPDDAAAALEALDPRRVLAGAAGAGDRPVAFLFPGGGSQHPNMGRELYRTEAVFRDEVDRCAAVLAPLLQLELRAVLYPEDGDLAGAAQRLRRPDVALPALFVTEHALARLWMSWGIQPRALIGHSLGEYVAACIAGVFSREDALALTVFRGRLMSELPSGGMLVVELSEPELGSIVLAGRPPLSCAAVNAPRQCVVSGPGPLLVDVARQLDARGVRVHRVAIDVAAHSALVAEVVPAFRDFVAKLRLQAPDLPLVSNVTGTWLQPGASPQLLDPRFRGARGVQQRSARVPGRPDLGDGRRDATARRIRGQPRRRSALVIRPQKSSMAYFPLTTVSKAGSLSASICRIEELTRPIRLRSSLQSLAP
jgi:acyl transferase domain-containing protein